MPQWEAMERRAMEKRVLDDGTWHRVSQYERQPHPERVADARLGELLGKRLPLLLLLLSLPLWPSGNHLALSSWRRVEGIQALARTRTQS